MASAEAGVRGAKELLRRAVPFLLLLLVLGLFFGGLSARQEAGLEVSVQSVQDWVADLGWRAPAFYIGLVTFRIFFLLPSWVILSAGGLVFGPWLGTLLGGLGILASSLVAFGVARGIGQDWLRPRLSRRYSAYQRTVDHAGPLIVGVTTAHPIGPMSVLHVAAGLSTVSLLAFVVAVVVGGPVRAFLYSLFGAPLLEPTSWEFALATALLVCVTLLPLAHPGIRRWLLGRPEPDDETSGEM